MIESSNTKAHQGATQPRPRPAPPPGGFMPAWTWEELELALLCMPLRASQRLAVPTLVSASRLASPYQSPITTLKEVVALISGLGEDLEPVLGAGCHGEGQPMP